MTPDNQIFAEPNESAGGSHRSIPRIQPMEALNRDLTFDHPEWIYELKYNGIRTLASVHPNGAEIYSRNFSSMNEHYPLIVEDLKKLQHAVVLDGELVIDRINGQATGDVRYYVFDLIYLNGYNLSEVPLIRRKELLKSLMDTIESGNIIYTEHVQQSGSELLEAAGRNNLEGIIAKNALSPYRQGQSTPEWISIRVMQKQDVNVVGFTHPQPEKSFFSSLVLAIKKGNAFEFAGFCETGFNEKSLEKIYNALLPHHINSSVLVNTDLVKTNVQWVKPKVIVTVNYRELSADGTFLNPIFSKLKVKR